MQRGSRNLVACPKILILTGSCDHDHREELEQHRGYDNLRYETPSMLTGTTPTPSGVLWA